MGARYTGTSIAPDEHFQVDLDLDYDGKRDRWNGYDPEEHQRIVEEYAKVDLVSSLRTGCFPYFSRKNLSSILITPLLFWQAKRTLKAQRLQDELASGKLDQTVSVCSF